MLESESLFVLPFLTYHIQNGEFEPRHFQYNNISFPNFPNLYFGLTTFAELTYMVPILEVQK